MIRSFVTAVRIFRTILNLYRSERSLGFFGGIGIALATISVGLAIPIFATYLEEGIVPRLPTAVLSTGLMVLAAQQGAAALPRGRRRPPVSSRLNNRAPALIPPK
jgi:hypothetical protein